MNRTIGRFLALATAAPLLAVAATAPAHAAAIRVVAEPQDDGTLLATCGHPRSDLLAFTVETTLQGPGFDANDVSKVVVRAVHGNIGAPFGAVAVHRVKVDYFADSFDADDPSWIRSDAGRTPIQDFSDGGRSVSDGVARFGKGVDDVGALRATVDWIEVKPRTSTTEKTQVESLVCSFLLPTTSSVPVEESGSVTFHD